MGTATQVFAPSFLFQPVIADSRLQLVTAMAMFAEDTVTIAGACMFGLESACRLSPALRHNAVDRMLDMAWRRCSIKFHDLSQAGASARVMPIKMNDEAAFVQEKVREPIQRKGGGDHAKLSTDGTFREAIKEHHCETLLHLGSGVVASMERHAITALHAHVSTVCGLTQGAGLASDPAACHRLLFDMQARACMVKNARPKGFIKSVERVAHILRRDAELNADIDSPLSSHELLGIINTGLDNPL